ncbi:PorP/SprF family type IX secretion system membrane protein [Neptunitalea lumnitzerae]|uniref:Membrane protein n=1 Tax=Neptunitalea lumnitzerae TaxID=2965509 RepID=A0ABQ5ML69_9FLAO|nr:type IX secretion system membrane protein PorP/SprF [Neptunitalea sp. Y10]GLB50118.1 membrane protein [Neptunitalea sp. Y10]
MKNNKILVVLIVALFSLVAKAQQDPQYTQYMYNMSVINPAYATDNPDIVNLGGIYRAQWMSIEGAPRTASFFVHTPLSRKVEMGLSVVHDEIGNIVNENNAYVDFAYVLSLSETSRLSFGLKAGATFYDTDFSNFVLTDDMPDTAFSENISRIFPNVGAGVFYFSDKYYLGLSVPNLLKSHHIENQDGISYQSVEDYHFFFTGGYVFNLNDNLKFKPAFMAKTVFDAPMSLDVTANFLFNNRVEMGAAYRWDDAVSGLINFRLSPSLRIGYAYDHTLSNLGRFNSGSHEIMVLFDINKLGKNNGFDISPRFF